MATVAAVKHAHRNRYIRSHYRRSSGPQAVSTAPLSVPESGSFNEVSGRRDLWPSCAPLSSRSPSLLLVGPSPLRRPISIVVLGAVGFDRNSTCGRRARVRAGDCVADAQSVALAPPDSRTGTIGRGPSMVHKVSPPRVGGEGWGLHRPGPAPVVLRIGRWMLLRLSGQCGATYPVTWWQD